MGSSDKPATPLADPERIADCAADPNADPAETFGDPLPVAQSAAAAYEDRLKVLQRWRKLAKERQGDDVEAVNAAIHALETGAVLRTDQPEGAPDNWGYAAPAARDKT
jgi:hypothetical protein